MNYKPFPECQEAIIYTQEAKNKLRKPINRFRKKNFYSGANYIF